MGEPELPPLRCGLAEIAVPLGKSAAVHSFPVSDPTSGGLNTAKRQRSDLLVRWSGLRAEG